jgi:hypothetical protein
MFGVSDRARQKWIAAINELNRGQGDARDVLAGRAQFRWTTGGITTLAIVGGVMVLLFASTGQIGIPGALAILYFINSTRPPRAVAVTDSEVLVAQRSFWNARPNKIVARAPFASVGRSPESRLLTVGDERITFNSKENARLQAIVQGSPA